MEQPSMMPSNAYAAYAHMYAPPPQMYGMPPEGYSYGGFFPGYMGVPPMPQDMGFGAPPPHMQGINPPVFPPGMSVDPFAPAPASQGHAEPSVDAIAETSLPNQATATASGTAPKGVPGHSASEQPDNIRTSSSKHVEAQAPAKTRSMEQPKKAQEQQSADKPKQTKETDPSKVTQRPTKPQPAKETSSGKVAADPTSFADLQQHMSSLSVDTRASAPQERQRPAVPGLAPGAVAAHRDTSVPSCDFDFESANARFRKEGQVSSNTDNRRLDAIPPPAASTNFYDKKSGFFDNISSEIKERHEGGPGTRAHAADERARNVQTFGDNAASYRGSNRRGGRSRGGRGRGPRKESKPAWA